MQILGVATEKLFKSTHEKLVLKKRKKNTFLAFFLKNSIVLTSLHLSKVLILIPIFEI